MNLMLRTLEIMARYNVDPTPLPMISADADRIQIMLTVAFTILGAICFLFVVIGGFRYVAAQGEPQAAARAKGTIMYALIGLMVSICAVIIVTFVLRSLS